MTCHYSILGKCGHRVWLEQPNVWRVLEFLDNNPRIDTETQNAKYRDGVLVKSKRYDARTVTMRHLQRDPCPCDFSSVTSLFSALGCQQCGETACWSVRNPVTKKWQLCLDEYTKPGYTECRLTKHICSKNGGYNEYALEVVLSAVRTATKMQNCREREIEFLAPFPFWHERKPQTFIFCPKKLTFNWCADICFGRYSFNECIQLPYSGQVNSYPIIRFSGIDNLTITNTTTGASTFLGSAGLDETVTLDLQKKTLTSSNNRDASSVVDLTTCWSGQYLPAGCPAVEFCLSGDSWLPGKSALQIQYYNWFYEIP